MVVVSIDVKILSVGLELCVIQILENVYVSQISSVIQNTFVCHVSDLKTCRLKLDCMIFHSCI